MRYRPSRIVPGPNRPWSMLPEDVSQPLSDAGVVTDLVTAEARWVVSSTRQFYAAAASMEGVAAVIYRSLPRRRLAVPAV